MLLEVAAFNACLQLMGLIGTAELAAHQIALQLASISFMLPLGIGQAATVRVGWFAGAGQMAAAARAGWMAYALGVGIVAISALLFVVIPRPLIGLFIDAGAAENAAVVAFAVQFLVVVAAFQLVDAAQVVMAGALRGLKDTKVPLLISAIAYWPLGLGLAWALGFHTEWRGVGIWIASAVGLTFAAILLTWRFARLTRHAQAAT
jgi:MATE family multidrug resistance protein